MTAWILLVVFIYKPYTTYATRYPDEVSCEKALKAYQENGEQLEAVCYQDYGNGGR